MKAGRGLKHSRFEKENRSIVIMGRIKVIRKEIIIKERIF